MLLPTVAALLAQGCLSLAASIETRQSGARAFVSTRNLELALSEVDAPISGKGDTGGRNTWDIGINDTPSGFKQTVKGFGGTVTDATVFAINQLPDDQRSQLLRELMTGDGDRAANFAYMRHTIGASDLSADPAYTYDDNGGQDDPDINGFGLGDRGEAMARLLAEMKQLNPDTTIHGSPWSAPAWMKPNRVSNTLDGTGISERL
jgi:glucan endo-1,6-beta-glucosidase